MSAAKPIADSRPNGRSFLQSTNTEAFLKVQSVDAFPTAITDVRFGTELFSASSYLLQRVRFTVTILWLRCSQQKVPIGLSYQGVAEYINQCSTGAGSSLELKNEFFYALGSHW